MINNRLNSIKTIKQTLFVQKYNIKNSPNQIIYKQQKASHHIQANNNQSSMLHNNDQSCFQTEADNAFFSKLLQSMKGIFSMSRQEWSCEQILRFLALIKVETKLESFFYQFKITGELLFDVRYLWEKMVRYLESRTYFPIMKLMYIVTRLNWMEYKKGFVVKFVRVSDGEKSTTTENSKEDNSNNLSSINGYCNSNSNIITKQRLPQLSKGEKTSTKTQKSQSQQSLSLSPNRQHQTIQQPQDQQPQQESLTIDLQYISADGQLLLLLQKQFSQIGQVIIADLSANQLARIFRSTQNQKAIQLSQMIKKYSIDGYCVVCLLAQRQKYLQQMTSFFSQVEIRQFQQILNLILPFYYKQTYDSQQKTSPFLNDHKLNLDFFYKSEEKPINDIMNTSKVSLGTSEMGTSEMGTSQMGASQIYGQSQSTGQLQGSVEYGVSQDDQSSSYIRQQSMGHSQMGRSQYAKSVYGQSQYGNSQYATSQYATSEIGSARGSMAESVMGESVVFYQENKQKHKNVRISSVEDLSIVNRLKQVALSLPFNLFKMEPLQNIKVTILNYPFTLNFPKPQSHDQFVRSLKQSVEKLKQCSSNNGVCSKDFNITGVKFGRSQQNDFRYPDQLSISAKHAQIGFWNNKYQLIDLQSKTGTFLYIPLTRPLVLKDEQIIQLSNEIEIIVHILKKQPNEGTIKLQFTKPENEPFYKATLKQNQALKIGRSQKSHIKLCQQSISSKHTQIKYQNKQFKLYDCLSSTGTWLRLSKKGVKSQMFQLQQGDIIRISSKKTYLIERIRNCLNQQDDQQIDQMESLLEDSNNFKVNRADSEVNFNNIIYNTWKRKTPYEKKEVHFETHQVDN